MGLNGRDISALRAVASILSGYWGGTGSAAKSLGTRVLAAAGCSLAAKLHDLYEYVADLGLGVPVVAVAVGRVHGVRYPDVREIPALVGATSPAVHAHSGARRFGSGVVSGNW